MKLSRKQSSQHSIKVAIILLVSTQGAASKYDDVHTIPHTALRDIRDTRRVHPPTNRSRNGSRILDQTKGDPGKIPRVATAAFQTSTMGLRSGMDDSLRVHGIRSA